MSKNSFLICLIAAVSFIHCNEKDKPHANATASMELTKINTQSSSTTLGQTGVTPETAALPVNSFQDNMFFEEAFAYYAETNKTPDFNADDMNTMLASATLSIDDQKKLAQHYLNAIEYKPTFSTDEENKEFVEKHLTAQYNESIFDFYAMNPIFRSVLEEKISEDLKKYGSLSKNELRVAAPMTYVINLFKKFYPNDGVGLDIYETTSTTEKKKYRVMSLLRIDFSSTDKKELTDADKKNLEAVSLILANYLFSSYGNLVPVQISGFSNTDQKVPEFTELVKTYLGDFAAHFDIVNRNNEFPWKVDANDAANRRVEFIVYFNYAAEQAAQQ